MFAVRCSENCNFSSKVDLFWVYQVLHGNGISNRTWDIEPFLAHVTSNGEADSAPKMHCFE